MLFIFLLSLTGFSEYRVFELKILAANKQDFRLVNSNLDPEQYPTYYPLNPGETLSYSNTWMCKGRTDSKEICPNPKALPKTGNSPENP